MDNTITGQANSTTSVVNYTFPLNKKDIVQRLFIEEKITFDEMWILLQNDDIQYIPMPYPNPSPIYPYPWYQPPLYTTSNSTGDATCNSETIGKDSVL